jgi:hypothetical protein
MLLLPWRRLQQSVDNVAPLAQQPRERLEERC